jgi:ABC-type Na+ efflux pump permease subunit
MTSLAITRERELGTMENLLAMPVRPVEVMLGKIIPYVGLAYVQTLLILVVSVTVFAVPVRGSVPLLLFALGVFIACNLAMGFACSGSAIGTVRVTINQSISKFRFIFKRHIARTAFGRRHKSSAGSFAGCAWRRPPCF